MTTISHDHDRIEDNADAAVNEGAAPVKATKTDAAKSSTGNGRPRHPEFLGTINTHADTFTYAMMIARIVRANGGDNSDPEEFQRIAAKRGCTFTDEQLAVLTAI
ncbi:hypothetical protein [Bifidobacterium catulorum]|uniref:Uncharacterized protein n=1 Tax=Bifidobacterium catulorum TaxID=1630173 RepID=A0A2U2MQG2_9BIFI|nr:hypothetical protein [Bifidobacterium catulorum]PWG59081.1 hypothetical protein DF200_09455 [Bifidobacterium catulorum]